MAKYIEYTGKTDRDVFNAPVEVHVESSKDLIEYGDIYITQGREQISVSARNAVALMDLLEKAVDVTRKNIKIKTESLPIIEGKGDIDREGK